MHTSALRTIWAIFKKDMRVWMRRPVIALTMVIPPLAFLLIAALGAAAVGRSPVALVNQDTGSQGALVVQAIERSEVFRSRIVDAQEGQARLRQLDVVAVITIPPDFSLRIATHQAAPIDVTINNLNLDFTNDIRRAVPDAITQYYLAQGTSSPINVTMRERDLRQQDVQLFQYETLPAILLLLMISGLVNGGQAVSREWESRSVTELLVAPIARGTIVAGKVLAGFVTTFLLGVSVALLAYALGWIHPKGEYRAITLLLMALISLLSAALGIALGALVRRIQPVIAIAINVAIYLFFTAGGIGVLAFEPDWLQQIAAYDPLTYGRHALEMAVFYNSADLLGRDVGTLALTTLVALALGVVALRRSIAR